MARIDLTPMQSQYVDPGYTKVAQVLRERYDKTLEKKSLLDRAYAQIQVGQGDEWLVNNAKADGQRILQNYAANGNWESGSASLAIDDATNSLLANRGVQLGQQSYKTRQDELAFINKERLNGNNFWDFGSISFDQHQSYVQDENGVWKENPYQVQHEKELDYNGEMSSLVQNFGQDRYASDKYIDDVYSTYIQSQVGDQDFRRLALIQLRQQFPDATPEELMVLAETNIKDRLKTFTRQAEYQNVVGSNDGTSTRTQKSERITEPLHTIEPSSETSFASSANYLHTNQDSKLTDEERSAKLQELMVLRDDTYKEVATKSGNTGAYNEYKKLYSQFENVAGEEESDRYLELFETLNMLTTNSNSSFNNSYDVSEGVAGYAVGTGVVGSALGASIGGPFAPLTGAAGFGIGAAVGGGVKLLTNIGEELHEQFTDLNNVRDWERPQEEGIVSMFIDTESNQLMDEMEKLDALNKAMPSANWTKGDLPKMKQLAKAMYVYKTEMGGDALDESWSNNGPYLTREGVRFDASPDGAKYRTAFNKALQAADPQASFSMVGMSKKEKEDFAKSWGNNTQVNAAFMADPLRNLPTALKIQYTNSDDETASKMLRGIPGRQSGWTSDIAESMQDYRFVENENILLNLQALKNSGKALTTKDYFNTRQKVLAQRLGGDAAKQQISYELDQMVVAEIYDNPSYTSGKVIPGEGGNITIGGSTVLRDNQGAKEFWDNSQGKWTILDVRTMPAFQQQYRQTALAASSAILNDSKINAYY